MISSGRVISDIINTASVVSLSFVFQVIMYNNCISMRISKVKIQFFIVGASQTPRLRNVGSLI